jgi:hypothetical protein
VITVERMRAAPIAAQWRILPLLLLLLLGACAGFVVNREKVQGIRTIGIISALPSTFRVQNIGLTVFGNDLKEFPIDAWGLDDYATGKARALLTGRYDVRPVTYQRTAIAAAGESLGSGLGERIRPFISTQGLDAYVVLRGRSSQYLSTNQYVGGFGIVEHLSLNYTVFALYGVRLIDGHDFSFLGSGAAPSGVPVSGPSLKVDQTWWPTSLDAASNPRLKAAVIDLVDQSLPTALRGVQLLD